LESSYQNVVEKNLLERTMNMRPRRVELSSKLYVSMTDAGKKEQEQTRSRTLTAVTLTSLEVWFIMHESVFKSGLPQVEYQTARSNNIVC
jgi:hypothetical protein